MAPTFWDLNPLPIPRPTQLEGVDRDPIYLIECQSMKPDDVDWLNDRLEALIQEHTPVDKDIDKETGLVDPNSIEASAKSLFSKSLCFFNFYQCKQFAKTWAENCGIHLSTRGNELQCFFCPRERTKPKNQLFHPYKKRDRVSLKTGCQFVIKTSPYPIPVKITQSSNFKHKCKTTLQKHRRAKKAAGNYAKDVKKKKLPSNTPTGTNLSKFPVHLGLQATAVSEPAFTDDMAWHQSYSSRHATDGPEGRLVAQHTFNESWDSWKVHPNGSEVVVCLDGAVDLVQPKQCRAVAR